ncbi:MAG: GGDEF domain-containing protein [Solirubrobacteraceae bacterium]|nr:GGDEF domain-containing protein [Solirubrobacteraceae bacterium]
MASLVEVSRSDSFGRPKDRRAARTARARPRVVDSILGRRDVALVPWASLFAASLGIIASTLLRPGAAGGDLNVIGGALVAATITGVLSVIQDTALGLRFRSSLWVYVLGAGSMMLALAALAVYDQGVATVYFAATVSIAAYIGLVFPALWSRIALGFMIATGIAVHVANPAAEPLDAVIAIALIAAGWGVGALGNLAHSRAASVANALSSFDRLTKMLNRRGILQQIDRLLSTKGQHGAVALLIIDLDGFKKVNDALGHAAGDAILEWVGQAMPDALPANAELGRLGGDEFAVLLEGEHASYTNARMIAESVRTVLLPRIGASVGVATSETRAVSATDLFRVADAALYQSKADPDVRVHALVAGTVPDSAQVPLDGAPMRVRHPLSYASLRATGKVPRSPEPGVVYGWLISLGLVVIAMAGLTVVVDAIINPGQGFYDHVLYYAGIPWVLWFFALAALMGNRGIIDEGPLYRLIFYGSNVALAIGVGTAMLAHGGLTAPIVAALFLRVLFDAAVLPKGRSRGTLILMVGGWALVVALSPADTLWVVPFHLTAFGASFALGIISSRAFNDVTDHMLSLARTDALTLLDNRLGFEEEAQRALDAATRSGDPFGLLVLDLDDFKSVNDTQGHAAGDELLRRVAGVLADSFPDSPAIGRLGGDEFALAIGVSGADDARLAARTLGASLRAIAGTSIGYAVHPADGTDLSTLMAVADRRSYSEKRAGKAAKAA